MNVLLDTHIWVRWVTPDSSMRAAEREALDRLSGKAAPLLSAISLWEVQMLVRKGRLKLPMPLEQWFSKAAAPDAVEIVPITAEVILALDQLPRSFHGDPADRLIVASALSRGVPLATEDGGIRRSRVTPLWKPS